MKMLGQIRAGIGFSFPEEGWIYFSVVNAVGSHAECSSPFLFSASSQSVESWNRLYYSNLKPNKLLLSG